MLHRNVNITVNSLSPASSGPVVTPYEPTASTSVSATSCTTSRVSQASTVLLSTAQLGLKNRHGRFLVVRALLDSGSQANLITQACVKRLALQYKRSSVPIECLNNTALDNVQVITKCTAKPLDTTLDSVLEFYAIVLPLLFSPITRELSFILPLGHTLNI